MTDPRVVELDLATQVGRYWRIVLILLSTALAVMLAFFVLVVIQQVQSAGRAQRIEELAQQTRESLAILRCSSGVTVLIPATDPDWRNRAYARCLVISHAPPYDPNAQRAVDETRAAPKA